MSHVGLVQADSLSIPIRDNSINCIITSPPYFGVRDYGTGAWEGGDPACDHSRRTSPKEHSVTTASRPSNVNHEREGWKGGICKKCGAVRQDAQLGMENVHDCGAWARGEPPCEQSCYLCHLRMVAKELWRVLRDDGVMFVNISDTYAGSWGAQSRPNGNDIDSTLQGGSMLSARQIQAHPRGTTHTGSLKHTPGLRPKSLCGIPQRLALALQTPYALPCCVTSEVDKAWLAATFDGEGTIGIRRFNSHRKELHQHYQDGYIVYTSVTNSDIELLDHCIAITGYGSARLKWGGKAGSTDNRGVTTRRDSYGWRLDANPAVDVIRAIYPYLIVKKKQAIIGYTLDVLNKQGRSLRGNKPVAQELQEKRVYLKELMHRCNQRQPVDLPSWVEEPKQKIQPGWIWRSDIVWHKPSCMPESVNDRPTRSHEYVLLFAKQAKYFWDAVAIAEPALVGANGSSFTSAHDLATKPGLGQGPRREHATRNSRTVWTVPSEPQGSYGRISRQVHVARDAVSGDTMCRVSLNCPVHGGLAGQSSNGPYDVRVDVLLRRIVHTEDHHAQGQLVDSVSTDPTPDRTIAQQNLDGSHQPCELSATGHSTPNRKTALVPETTAPGTPCVETADHTDNRQASRALSVPNPGSDGNNTVLGDLPENQMPENPCRIADTHTAQGSFLPSIPPECICIFYNTIHQEASHYAAFPVALAAKMIHAGSSQHGVCRACGAPWTRIMAPTGALIPQRHTPSEDHYHTKANGRHGVTSSFTTGFSPAKHTTGWRPTCTCFYGPGYAEPVPAVILDPFVGSGSTLLAARALGRHGIGLDLSWNYLAKIARERLGLAALDRWSGKADTRQPPRYSDLPLFTQEV